VRRFKSGLTALSLLCLLAAGCTSNSGTSATVSGGTLTWGKQAEALEIDPQVGGNGVSWGIEDIVYETLVGVGDDLSLQPRLATSWEQPSSTTYIFHLRQGVKFSNGRAMVADDVVASFKRLIDPKLASYWTQQVGPVKDVIAVDDKTVRFELGSPFTPFLAAVAHVGAAILPMKEFAAGTFDPSKQLMGTGPFMQVSHNQGESWTFARNPNYWRSGYPKADKLVVKIIPDDSARLAALRDGSVDVATFENVDASKLLASVPNVKSVVQDSTDFNVIHVNALGPTSPFRDARVRQAFSMAIDRTKLRDIALGGIGQVQGVVSPSFKVPGCSPSALPNFSHDLTKAKQLLADAGKSGMSFELLLTTAFATAPGEAQVIQQNLKDIGVTVKITQLEIGAWETRTFVKNPPEMDASISWFAGYADPGMVIAWWNPDYALFDKGYMQKDPQLIDLINQARTTPAGPARNDILGQVCKLIDQDANIIPMASRPDIVGYRSDHISAKIQPVEGYGDVLRHLQEFARVSGS
jgi:peptide/nickel transport system substrate-binding protein